jgi:hypothetical protein
VSHKNTNTKFYNVICLFKTQEGEDQVEFICKQNSGGILKERTTEEFWNLLSTLEEEKALYHRITGIALRILYSRRSKTIKAPRKEFPRPCETTKKGQSKPKGRGRKQKIGCLSQECIKSSVTPTECLAIPKW